MVYLLVGNKHSQLDTHFTFHLHFIKVQSLDMFRALLAHLQEALHERRFGDLCAVVDLGWSQDVGRLPLRLKQTNPHLQPHTMFTKPAFV
jgi:hypothetical protein